MLKKRLKNIFARNGVNLPLARNSDKQDSMRSESAWFLTLIAAKSPDGNDSGERMAAACAWAFNNGAVAGKDSAPEHSKGKAAELPDMRAAWMFLRGRFDSFERAREGFWTVEKNNEHRKKSVKLMRELDKMLSVDAGFDFHINKIKGVLLLDTAKMGGDPPYADGMTEEMLGNWTQKAMREFFSESRAPFRVARVWDEEGMYQKITIFAHDAAMDAYARAFGQAPRAEQVVEIDLDYSEDDQIKVDIIGGEQYADNANLRTAMGLLLHDQALRSFRSQIKLPSKWNDVANSINAVHVLATGAFAGTGDNAARLAMPETGFLPTVFYNAAPVTAHRDGDEVVLRADDGLQEWRFSRDTEAGRLMANMLDQYRQYGSVSAERRKKFAALNDGGAAHDVRFLEAGNG